MNEHVGILVAPGHNYRTMSSDASRENSWQHSQTEHLAQER